MAKTEHPTSQQQEACRLEQIGHNVHINPSFGETLSNLLAQDLHLSLGT